MAWQMIALGVAQLGLSVWSSNKAQRAQREARRESLLGSARSRESYAKSLEVEAEQEVKNGKLEAMDADKQLASARGANIVNNFHRGLRLEGSVLEINESLQRERDFFVGVTSANAAIAAGEKYRQAKFERAEAQKERTSV